MVAGICVFVFVGEIVAAGALFLSPKRPSTASAVICMSCLVAGNRPRRRVTFVRLFGEVGGMKVER